MKSFKVRFEEFHRAGPRELRGGAIVGGARLVCEGMCRLVAVKLEAYVGSCQLLLIA
jgi:hypothetical protein